jgi:NTE family protein
VIFGPDVTGRPGHGSRTALVLGAGGVLGAAWMTGALVSLQDQLPYPAGEAGIIVGTSAGSVLAAALRCHATLEEMVAWQHGQATGIFTGPAALAARERALPPLPYPRLGSVPLARAALFRPHRVPPLVAAAAWLPHGRGQHHALRSLVGALHQRASLDGGPPHWVDGHTWLSAMDYDTGQRVLFGRGDAPCASLADAVVASCSIPGWYEPAVIGGRRYVDGGVRSTTSLSVLSGTNVQEIYVLAPMASTEADHPLQPHLRLERRVRQLITRAVVAQARVLGAQGKRVTVLTPGPEDLAVIGANLMDSRRRQAVLDTSLRTCARALDADRLRAAG